VEKEEIKNEKNDYDTDVYRSIPEAV